MKKHFISIVLCSTKVPKGFFSFSLNSCIEVSDLKIALLGSRELTELDKKEIKEYLDVVTQAGDTINLFVFRSIEIEVFKFFIENEKNNPQLASQLHIIALNDIQLLPKKVRVSIEYLISKGATFESLDLNISNMTRKPFTKIWNYIIQKSDSVVCFYNPKFPSLYIPVDEAIRLNKKSIVYELPGENKNKHLLPTKNKLKLKRHHGLN